MSAIAGYIFGYGSLLDPISMATTLFGDHATLSGPIEALLVGYRRTWNVAVPSGPGQRRPLQYADHTPYLHDIACLGLEQLPGTSCRGAVFGLTEEALELLDEREQRYDRVEVSEAIYSPGAGLRPGPPDEPDPGQPRRIGLADDTVVPVWTYVPKPHVPVRFGQLLDAGQIVVTSEYLQHVENGMSLLGVHALAEYRAEPPPPCPLAELMPSLDHTDWDGDWDEWAVEGSA